MTKGLYLIIICSLWAHVAFAATVSIVPETILQGDPLMVTATTSSSLKSVIFDGGQIPIFIYEHQPRALVGIELSQNPGNYKLTARFANGETLQKTITVTKRQKAEVPLGIPQKLGGNSTTSQKNLIASIATENDAIKKIRSGVKQFWSAQFIYPVKDPIVTDIYGYNRKTGDYTLAHKGTDFRAAEGTKVMAMNRGVVRIARSYRVYGKMILVDHGLGLQTLYLHLSKMNVREGELVQLGQVIGLSGETGYAEKPHLHVSVKINGVSIDPVKFLALFNTKP